MTEGLEPSKTQRKKAMHGLQDLGSALTRLSSQQLADLPLPPALADAIVEAKRLRAREAIRRQMQYIGRLMRDADVTAIQAKMQEWITGERRDTAHFHALELWRDKLLADDNSWEKFTLAFPQADLTLIRKLIEAARQESLHNRPPKSARALFRALRDASPE